MLDEWAEVGVLRRVILPVLAVLTTNSAYSSCPRTRNSSPRRSLAMAVESPAALIN